MIFYALIAAVAAWIIVLAVVDGYDRWKYARDVEEAFRHYKVEGWMG